MTKVRRGLVALLAAASGCAAQPMVTTSWALHEECGDHLALWRVLCTETSEPTAAVLIRQRKEGEQVSLGGQRIEAPFPVELRTSGAGRGRAEILVGGRSIVSPRVWEIMDRGDTAELWNHFVLYFNDREGNPRKADLSSASDSIRPYFVAPSLAEGAEGQNAEGFPTCETLSAFWEQYIVPQGGSD